MSKNNKILSKKDHDKEAFAIIFDHEENVYKVIKEKRDNGEFAHQIGSINSHLSIQQAQKFILENAGEKYEFITLHQSKEF